MEGVDDEYENIKASRYVREVDAVRRVSEDPRRWCVRNWIGLCLTRPLKHVLRTGFVLSPMAPG